MSSIVKKTTEIVWAHNVDKLKDKYCVFHLKDGPYVCGWVDSIGVTSMIIFDRYNCNARTLLTTELDPDTYYTQYELATGIMPEEPIVDVSKQSWLLSSKVTYEFDTESDLYEAFISGNHIAVFHNKMNLHMALYFIGFCDDDSIQVRFCQDNTIYRYSAKEFDETFSNIELFTPGDKSTSDESASDECSDLHAIDAVIGYCLRMANSDESLANTKNTQAQWGASSADTADTLRQSAELNRQIAKWLTEFKEAMRLLRLAVEDFDILGEVKFSPKPGVHPKRREYIRILDLLDHRWRYADEALKLLKEGR